MTLEGARMVVVVVVVVVDDSDKVETFDDDVISVVSMVGENIQKDSPSPCDSLFPLVL